MSVKGKRAGEKISVIGGAGFIGTALCRNLSAAGIEFEIIDLKISRSFPNASKIGDVRDVSSLQNAITGSIIVNLAAVHRDDVQDPSEYYRTTAMGQKMSAKLPIKLVSIE